MLRLQRGDPIPFRLKGLEGLHAHRHHPVLHHVVIRIARPLVDGRNHLRIGRIRSIDKKRLSVDTMGEALLPVQKLVLIQMVFVVMCDEAGVDGRQIQPVKQAVDIGIRIQVKKQRIVHERLAPRPDIPSARLSALFTDLTSAEGRGHSLACRGAKIFDLHSLSLHAGTLCVKTRAPFLPFGVCAGIFPDYLFFPEEMQASFPQGATVHTQ